MANIMRAKKLIICANNLISTSPFLWPGNNFCGRRTLASVFLRFYSGKLSLFFLYLLFIHNTNNGMALPFSLYLCCPATTLFAQHLGNCQPFWNVQQRQRL